MGQDEVNAIGILTEPIANFHEEVKQKLFEKRPGKGISVIEKEKRLEAWKCGRVIVPGNNDRIDSVFFGKGLAFNKLMFFDNDPHSLDFFQLGNKKAEPLITKKNSEVKRRNPFEMDFLIAGMNRICIYCNELMEFYDIKKGRIAVKDMDPKSLYTIAATTNEFFMIAKETQGDWIYNLEVFRFKSPEKLVHSITINSSAFPFTYKITKDEIGIIFERKKGLYKTIVTARFNFETKKFKEIETIDAEKRDFENLYQTGVITDQHVIFQGFYGPIIIKKDNCKVVFKEEKTQNRYRRIKIIQEDKQLVKVNSERFEILDFNGKKINEKRFKDMKNMEKNYLVAVTDDYLLFDSPKGQKDRELKLLELKKNEVIHTFTIQDVAELKAIKLNSRQIVIQYSKNKTKEGFICLYDLGLKKMKPILNWKRKKFNFQNMFRFNDHSLLVEEMRKDNMRIRNYLFKMNATKELKIYFMMCWIKQELNRDVLRYKIMDFISPDTTFNNFKVWNQVLHKPISNH